MMLNVFIHVTFTSKENDRDRKTIRREKENY